MRTNALLAMLLLLGACAAKDKQPAPPAQDTVAAAAPTPAPAGADRATQAAQVANAIAATPDKADSILKAAGYTPESFQQLMYQIAADSVLSATYAAARTK